MKSILIGLIALGASTASAMPDVAGDYTCKGTVEGLNENGRVVRQRFEGESIELYTQGEELSIYSNGEQLFETFPCANETIRESEDGISIVATLKCNASNISVAGTIKGNGENVSMGASVQRKSDSRVLVKLSATGRSEGEKIHGKIDAECTR